MSTSSGIEIEQNTFIGPLSTLMRFLTHRDGDLSTYFDIIDESQDGIIKSSLIQNT